MQLTKIKNENIRRMHKFLEVFHQIIYSNTFIHLICFPLLSVTLSHLISRHFLKRKTIGGVFFNFDSVALVR